MHPRWIPNTFQHQHGGPNVPGPQQGPIPQYNLPPMPPHPGGDHARPFFNAFPGPFQRNVFPNAGFPGPPMALPGLELNFRPPLTHFQSGFQPPPYASQPLEANQRLLPPQVKQADQKPHLSSSSHVRACRPLEIDSKRAWKNATVNTSDRALVDRFLASAGKLDSNRKICSNAESEGTKSTKLKIFEARQLHSKATAIIKDLEECSKDSSTNGDKIDGLKEELTKTLSILNDPEVLKGLQKKVAHRRKRRERLKRLKKKLFERKQETQRRIEAKHKEIDEWLQQEKIRSERQLREIEMQKQIDEALGEVRREKAVIAKQMETISLLAKLRKVRFNARHTRGQDVPGVDVNNHFDAVVKNARSALTAYKATCDEKASSLKMFIETEQREAKQAIERKRKKKDQEMKTRWEEERMKVLFGSSKADDLDPFDVLWPVQQLHQQANKSLHNLLQYRRMWDRYLHEKGTRISVGWVEPVEPASEEWAKYLTGQTTSVQDSASSKDTKT